MPVINLGCLGRPRENRGKTVVARSPKGQGSRWESARGAGVPGCGCGILMKHKIFEEEKEEEHDDMMMISEERLLFGQIP